MSSAATTILVGALGLIFPCVLQDDAVSPVRTTTSKWRTSGSYSVASSSARGSMTAASSFSPANARTAASESNSVRVTNSIAPSASRGA